MSDYTIQQPLSRRTVTSITKVLEPREIYKLITSKSWEYTPLYQQAYSCRDIAGMALSFLTVCRVTELFGGTKFRRVYIAGLNPDPLKCYVAEPIGKHPGLQREAIELTNKLFTIKDMDIVKRSHKLIAKRGAYITKRAELIYPVETGLFDSEYYDQLVPFVWLVKEYLDLYAPKKGKLFAYQDNRAWQIIRCCTGWMPNWFRMQADNFFGHHITKDSVKHSKMVGRVKAESSMPYIRFDARSDLKDKSLAMNFKWIQPAVNEIKNRLETAKNE
jgi:hypothetical protein